MAADPMDVVALGLCWEKRRSKMKLLRLVGVLEAGQTPPNCGVLVWPAELMATYWAVHGQSSVERWTCEQPSMGMKCSLVLATAGLSLP